MTTLPTSQHARDSVGTSLGAGWQLPAAMYSDPAIFEAEKELIFARARQYVGREQDLTEAGACLTAQLGDLPIVVVRDRDGALHGHVNVCRHGLHPVAEGTG